MKMTLQIMMENSTQNFTYNIKLKWHFKSIWKNSTHNFTSSNYCNTTWLPIHNIVTTTHTSKNFEQKWYFNSTWKHSTQKFTVIVTVKHDDSLDVCSTDVNGCSKQDISTPLQLTPDIVTTTINDSFDGYSPDNNENKSSEDECHYSDYQ